MFTSKFCWLHDDIGMPHRPEDKDCALCSCHKQDKFKKEVEDANTSE